MATAEEPNGAGEESAEEDSAEEDSAEEEEESGEEASGEEASGQGGEEKESAGEEEEEEEESAEEEEEEEEEAGDLEEPGQPGNQEGLPTPAHRQAPPSHAQLLTVRLNRQRRDPEGSRGPSSPPYKMVMQATRDGRLPQESVHSSSPTPPLFFTPPHTRPGQRRARSQAATSEASPTRTAAAAPTSAPSRSNLLDEWILNDPDL
jgi:hypothetical protein